MKVQCINNTSRYALDRNSYLNEMLDIDSLDDLDIGRIYDVMAVESQGSAGLFFYIHSMDGACFPVPYPASLFSIRDANISRSWTISFYEKKESIRFIFTFPEWAEDRMFYERLINSDEKAEKIYEEYRKTKID